MSSTVQDIEKYLDDTDNGVIYVKGLLKIEWLTHLAELCGGDLRSGRILNLENVDDDVPTLRDMSARYPSEVLPMCQHHSMSCALTHVFAMRDWWNARQRARKINTGCSCKFSNM